MATKKKMLQAAAGSAGGGFTAIEDVFSTYLYTGGTAQQINNGIDLDTEGGMVWIKRRNSTFVHQIFDTQRTSATYGTPTRLSTNTTSAADVYFTTGEFSWLADGFDLNNTDGGVNGSGGTYASWTFRKAPRFFDVVTYTGTGSARTVDHNLGTTVGSIIIKRTDTTSNWAVYHRGNTAAPETDFLSLNLTNATADDATYWNDTAPTDSVFTVGTNAAVNASGGTYVAYLFAHDPLGPSEDGSDGLISCGSYTGNSSANGPEIDLGWEPQWVLIKNTTWTGGQWMMFDSMRGMATGTGGDNYLNANQTYAEAPDTMIAATPTGFKLESDNYDVNNAFNYIYIAIRRGPMRVPESGTEVFNPAYTTSNQRITTNFPVDLQFGQFTGGGSNYAVSRMQGMSTSTTGSMQFMTTNSTNAESSNTGSLGFNGFDNTGFSHTLGNFAQRLWSFRRAPNFFDVVAYTGDGTAGRTVPHNLGVSPEMMIVKRRGPNTGNWPVYHASVGATHYSDLNQSNAFTASLGYWNNTAPTDAVFTVGSFGNVNFSGEAIIAYLFATLAGVSKVGSYTGNGSSQTIDCGFTSGARFILIKRTDSTGDWYVWDTARGIVTGNDPHLSLNTNAAEVTTDDSIDPDSSGFIVNQVAATNINVSAASYIFYAVA